MKTPFASAEVGHAFSLFSRAGRQRLLRVRQRIFDLAAGVEAVGAIQESLKWGEPSYVSTKRKCGTPIRLRLAADDTFGLSVHCQTSIIAELKKAHPGLRYDGSRSLLLPVAVEPPVEVIDQLIRLALTYHRNKR